MISFEKIEDYFEIKNFDKIEGCFSVMEYGEFC